MMDLSYVTHDKILGIWAPVAAKPETRDGPLTELCGTAAAQKLTSSQVVFILSIQIRMHVQILLSVSESAVRLP